MGSTLAARRVTGTLSGNAYARTEWLHRKHLQEAVGADHWNMSGCTNCSWSWACGEPFGSGGSDQLAGHKDDPETGMKYFGARCYHATSARWISADSVLAHAHDPRSLNKYAYVRNDPVNLVDRLGQWYECAYYSEGQCQWYYFDPTPHIQFWLHEGQDPYEGSGGGGGVEFSLAQFLNDREAVSYALKHRIFVGPDGTDRCKDFLLKLIAGLEGELTEGFNLQTLIDNILAAEKEVDPRLTTANARTIGNKIQMSPTPKERMGNDWVSILLHEGFHLQMSSRRGSQINDYVLGRQAAIVVNYPKEKVRDDPSGSQMAKQVFGEECGPGKISFLP